MYYLYKYWTLQSMIILHDLQYSMEENKFYIQFLVKFPFQSDIQSMILLEVDANAHSVTS